VSWFLAGFWFVFYAVALLAGCVAAVFVFGIVAIVVAIACCVAIATIDDMLPFPPPAKPESASLVDRG
jgi:hypothetical protein